MASHNFVIELADPEDVYFLPDIERRAGKIFEAYSDELGLSVDLFEHVNSIETISKAQQAGQLWVAKTKESGLIGFALVIEIEGFAHLEEISVLPSHGRQGVGTALLMTVCSWAKSAGFPAVTLRTFKNIPWNEPFYQHRGFKIIDSSSISDGHTQLELIEQQGGFRVEMRITMSFNLSG